MTHLLTRIYTHKWATTGACRECSRGRRWAGRSAEPWGELRDLRGVRVQGMCCVSLSLLFPKLSTLSLALMMTMLLCTVSNTDEPLLLQIPGMLKVRHIGRTTLGSAGLFSLFLGAGSLLRQARERERSSKTQQTTLTQGRRRGVECCSKKIKSKPGIICGHSRMRTRGD